MRGQPNRGLRRFSSTIAWMSSGEGPFGPGLPLRGRIQQSVLSLFEQAVKFQQRRRPNNYSGPLDMAWAEKQ